MNYSVTRLIHFCYGHRLLEYSGKCRRLHGHNGVLEIAVAAEKLDEPGMVVDFEEIKRRVQAWVDAELDHRMILNEKDPLAQALEKTGEPVVVLQANPTAENIARHIFDYAARSGLPVSSVRLWETRDSFAEVRR